MGGLQQHQEAGMAVVAPNHPHTQKRHTLDIKLWPSPTRREERSLKPEHMRLGPGLLRQTNHLAITFSH